MSQRILFKVVGTSFLFNIIDLPMLSILYSSSILNISHAFTFECFIYSIFVDN